MNKLTGTGVALVTPFDRNLQVDYQGLKKLLTYTAENGVDYYVVNGTTGESATTTTKEKAAILNFVKENNPKKLPIVFGIGGNNTAQILEDMDSVDFSGVDALLSVCPYYNKPSQEGLLQHYTAIADKSPVPVILYNVPGRTSCNISAATTLLLSAHPNIIGTKEASGNMEQCMEILNGKPDDFIFISGDDLLSCSLISLGAVGVISVLANTFPSLFSELIHSALNNDFATARKAAFKLLEINPLMYKEGNPVGVKQALKELGICGNEVRLPLVKASDNLTKAIQNAITKFEMVK
jgi:4-hydroxy-tetrahydrodipicolinate synthase